MVDLWGRLRPFAVHAVLAGTSGAVLGIIDALLAARGNGNAALSVWIALGCVPPIAVVLGLFQKPVVSALFRGLERFGLISRFTRHTTGNRTEPREPVVIAHTLALLGVFFLGLLLACVWGVRVGLQTVQDDALQTALLLIAIGLLVLAFVLLLLLLTAPVSRILSRFDERFGLPWPRSRAFRFFLAVFVPTVVVVAPLAAKHGEDLGNVLVSFEVALFVETQVLAFLLARSLRPSYERRLVLGGLALFFCTAAAQPITFNRAKAAKTVSRRGTLVPQAVWLLRRATDFDRDGFSSLYAGGDCAALNGHIHPQAEDVPGDGRDEDCDGADATSAVAGVRGPIFSSTLEPAAKKKYSIIWVVVDALRPDSMELYGYGRRNTPALKELSRSALTFEQAFAPSTTTHLSIPCMLTGKNADRITWEYRGDKTRVEIDQSVPTLARRLKSVGYRTAAIVSPHIRRLPAMLDGFDTVISTSSYRHSAGRDGPVSTALGIEFMEGDPGYLAGTKPFFLFVYYEDPHKPYTRHGPRFPDYGRSEKDLYDGEIAYADGYVGFLLDYIGVHTKAWDNTLVIFNSDHGEEFGDHGSTAHGKTCYGESAHVPLLFRIPQHTPSRVKQRVSLIDVVPTVLELVGAEAEPGDLDGQSLLVAEHGAGVALPSFCAILNQGGNAATTPFFTRSVRFESRGLIHNVLTDQFELYDETTDPKETKNIVLLPEEAAAVDKLKHLFVANATGNLFQRRIQ